MSKNKYRQHFENVTVTGQQLDFTGNGYQQTAKASKGLIEGTVLDNGDIYKMSDISFDQVKINDVCLTESNKNTYNQIDPITTENIVFNGCDSQKYTLSVSSSAHGNVKPLEGDITLLAGKSQTFTFAAEEGYKLSDVLVNDISQGAVASYTVSNASSNVKIEAIFVEL
ncbi:hypothetical protein DS2_10833 [Catenovulum agarivorans DS-2]|uniref:Uncharacterized protein n=1 Tax=Catenovulum agarivorans DS-2 TaxID=1328313 RepID=W7QCY6_9ALTE|nr:hypothetical protein [Catenovulum agarivorans]EWH09776.1 hypothetical protein DS2_10833 [Catenovulum agarivorans DS-2]